MKTVSPAVLALLKTRVFFASTLFTFTLATGTVLSYTSGDRDIAWSGVSYKSGGTNGLLIQRDPKSGGQSTTCTWKLGLEVSTLQFDVIPRGETINGVPFLEACKNGVFDGATLRRDRAYMAPAAPTGCVGTINLDVGRVGNIVAGRSYANFTISDYRELLNVNLPRNLYQAACSNSLYDASCGLNKAALAVGGTVTPGSNTSLISATLSQPTGYFDLGTVTFLTGENAGASRTVKQYIQGNQISLIAPFAYVPQTGDTFHIYPGCDKSVSTCGQKFGNIGRYRGFPFIPSAETGT